MERFQFIARGFPRTFAEADIFELMAHFGIREIKFSKRRGKITAILTVRNPVIADSVLTRLHQLRIGTARLSVEHYNRQSNQDDDALPAAPAVRESAQELSNYVRELHAVHPDFNQPPPPYLRYRYPKPTRDIINNICVTLESVPKFYVQVLHLMNRMNLPPPFTVKDLGAREDPRKDAAIQTDLTMIEESLLAEGESELESDEETTPKAHLKGKIVLNKNRFKPYIRPVVTSSVTKLKPTPTELFEQPKPKPTPAITIHIPEQLPTPAPSIKPKEPPPTQQEPSPPPPTSFTEQDLLANRVPPDQLTDLPVFKNYTPGDPSNKLYIKNLAKTVTEADLSQIFTLFANPGRADIQIKLMQTGRMKGQAFVTFSYAYPEDLDKLEERPIERARRLTNGFILRDKPMVVCYGRQEKVAATAAD